MNSKFLIMVGLTVGSAAGSFIPALWGADWFSMWSVFLGMVGGLVGIWNYPPLLDGGSVTAPRGAIYGLHGEWEVENHGIAPDIEVENDPASVAAGHDAQLEKAVQVTLEALKKNPVVIPDHPPYPNYHKK